MAQVKVSGRFYPEALPYVRNGRVKRGDYCRACGKKLTDAESKARGFGHTCYEKIPVLVVLEIQASGTTQLAPDAGDVVVSTSLSRASALSTSQAESAPTQRG